MKIETPLVESELEEQLDDAIDEINAYTYDQAVQLAMHSDRQTNEIVDNMNNNADIINRNINYVSADVDNLTDYVEGQLSWKINDIKEDTVNIEEKVDGVYTHIDNMSDNLSLDITDSIDETTGDIADTLVDTTNELGNDITKGLNIVSDTIDDMIDATGDYIDSGINAIGRFFTDVGNTVGDVIGDIPKGLESLSKAVNDGINSIVDDIESFIGDTILFAVGIVDDMVQGLKNWFSELFSVDSEKLIDTFASLMTAQKEAVQRMHIQTGGE